MSATIALAGNPNVGKSTVFNALTGLRQHTGNWAGKTVALSEGTGDFGGERYVVVDLPGTYSLTARSGEEEITREFLASGRADIVVVVCDAMCLERNLILALQIMAITPRVILCVNMMDEAKKRGVKVDLARLEKSLGVPVVPASARRRGGLDALIAAVRRLMTDSVTPRAYRVCAPRSLLVGDARRDEISRAYVLSAERFARASVTVPRGAYARDRRVDRVLTGSVCGTAVMLGLLGVIFWLTISGANAASSALAAGLFWVQDRLSAFLLALGAPDWLHGALVLGVYRTLAWVVSVMLPPMAIFFPIFTLLEDFGYLPRVAFNLDRRFKCAKSCGKQALTMCMGLGCNAAGVTGCRIIESQRERLIAVLTNAFVPCNGRFPMLIAIISMFFAGAVFGSAAPLIEVTMLTGAILLGVGLTFGVSRFLSATALRGARSAFTMELPPFRLPRIGRTIVRSLLDRTLFVLGRAVVVAAPAGLVIWLLANVTIGDSTALQAVAAFLDPFARLLGLDGVILLAFVLGFPANEIVFPIIIMTYSAAGALTDAQSLADLRNLLICNGWTWVTAVCTLLFCLVHWPCSTTCLTIKKETGSVRWTLLAVALPTAVGMLLCLIVATLARFAGFA
ncbi:MAG: ferrous iron transporter B [Oscillospiraceae bacterium]|jgi:ferrous iron transport protein B|nr:ferrous iron transporter B [Oscillospiraceae bacterium]